jgi:hypothetical protein
MRRPALILVAALTAVLQASPTAAQRGQASPPLAAEIHIMRIDDENAVDRLESPFILWGGAWDDWITPDDMPADLRRRPLQLYSVIAVEADAEGRPASCRTARAGREPRLDALACRLLRQRARFPVSYVKPGRAGPARWLLAVRWETVARGARTMSQRAIAAPRPPPAASRPAEDRPDRKWPRRSWSATLVLVSLPDVRAAYDAVPGRGTEGVTSLDLLVDAPRGVIGCEIGVGSGNAALDAAACRVARELDLSFVEPCAGCRDERLPLQFVWRPGASHVRFPLPPRFPPAFGRMSELRERGPRDPADTRHLLYSHPFGQSLAMNMNAPGEPPPADRGFVNNRVRLGYDFDDDGRVANCTALRSSGNPALDQWLCRRHSGRITMRPPTDVFGNVEGQPQTWEYDLARELPVRR